MPTSNIRQRPSSAQLSLRSESRKWLNRYTPELFHNPISRDRTKTYNSWKQTTNNKNTFNNNNYYKKHRPQSAHVQRTAVYIKSSPNILIGRRPKSAGIARDRRRIQSATIRRRKLYNKETKTYVKNNNVKDNLSHHQNKPSKFISQALREASSREKSAKHIKHTLTFHEPEVEVRPTSGHSGGLRNGQYYFLAAYQNRLRGDYSSAIKHYTSALAHYKQDVRALLNRGYCLCRIGRIERATVDFQRAAEINPTTPFGWYNLGLAHQKLHNTSKSIEALSKALECFEHLPKDHYHTWKDLKERDAFIESNMPLHASIILTRAMSYRLSNQFFEASRDYAKLEALKAKHGAERFGNVLNHKGNGGTEFFSTGPVYDLKKQSANYEQKSIGIDQLKKEGDLSHLSEYFQEALKSLQKQGTHRSEDDLKVLLDLTVNVPVFKKLSQENHKKLCRKMICVTLHDGDILFDQGEEGHLFYVIVVGKISLHMQSRHHRISSEREHTNIQQQGDEEEEETLKDDNEEASIDDSSKDTTTNNNNTTTKELSENNMTWETLWRNILLDKKNVKKFTTKDEKEMVYITTLHIGDSFGELALTENAPRRATCVSSGKSILLTVGKEDFDLILKQQHEEEIEKTWKFLKNVDLLRSINDEDLKSLAGIVEREHHNCDSILLAEGQDYHNLRIIRTGKCRVVKNLAIRNNHAVDHTHDAALTNVVGTTSPLSSKMDRKRRQRRRTVENLALVSSRHSQGNKYSVEREHDITWEIRRDEAVKDHLKLAKAKKNWNSSRHDAHHPDSVEAFELEEIHNHSNDENMKKGNKKQQKKVRRKEPVELCTLFPGDTIGEENILGVEDPKTGHVVHVRRKTNASIVADTQVEVLIIHKVDLFRRTNFSIRSKMRANVIAKRGRSHTSVLEDPGEQIKRKEAWEKYRAKLLKGLNDAHLARAVIHGR